MRLVPMLALATSAAAATAHLASVPQGRRLQPPAAFIDFCAHEPAECELVVEPLGHGGHPSIQAVKDELYLRYFWSVEFGDDPHHAQGAHAKPGEPVIREITKDPATVPREEMKTVERVNSTINHTVRPSMDQKLYGKDFWRLAIKEQHGDCEDYALTKRNQLIAAGVPFSALSIAIGQTRKGEKHAVLLVATDKGDVVLDNLSPHILAAREAPYTWRGRQTPGRPMIWESMKV
jgi:predicted transglutaminase-like cysteine proteinase